MFHKAKAHRTCSVRASRSIEFDRVRPELRQLANGSYKHKEDSLGFVRAGYRIPIPSLQQGFRPRRGAGKRWAKFPRQGANSSAAASESLMTVPSSVIATAADRAGGRETKWATTGSIGKWINSSLAGIPKRLKRNHPGSDQTRIGTIAKNEFVGHASTQSTTSNPTTTQNSVRSAHCCFPLCVRAEFPDQFSCSMWA